MTSGGAGQKRHGFGCARSRRLRYRPAVHSRLRAAYEFVNENATTAHAPDWLLEMFAQAPPLAGKKEARAELDKRIRSSENRPIEQNDLTGQDFVETYWGSYLDRKQVKPSTRRSYESGLRLHIKTATQESTSSCLQLELDADFIDQQEAVHQRKQFGQLNKSWHRNQQGNWELVCDYKAHHHFEHQGDKGDRGIHRSIAIEIANCRFQPSYSDNLITFQLRLNPLESWHACVRMYPHVENEPTFPLYDCYAIQDETTPYEVNRQLFLDETTRFASPTTGTLANAVVETLEQAKHDLAALRLHDLDQTAMLGCLLPESLSSLLCSVAIR